MTSYRPYGQAQQGFGQPFHLVSGNSPPFVQPPPFGQPPLSLEPAVLPTRSKVTLTNWERLNNSPLLLPHCSAVQWNEYVFVLARDGTALLYHTKHGIWSYLPSCNEQLPTFGSPPLVLHREQLLTMTSRGEVLHYSHEYSQWNCLRDQQLNLNKNATAIKLTSCGGLLFASVNSAKHEDRSHSLLCMLSVEDKKVYTYMYDPSTKWEKICEVDGYPLRSATVVGSDLYTLVGEKAYKLALPIGEVRASATAVIVTETKPPNSRSIKSSHHNQKTIPTRMLLSATTITKPRYKATTLHTVRDTLLAFGGRDEDNQPTSDVLQYNPDTDSWENAGYMRNSRYNVAVATDASDVHVLGGILGSSYLKMEPKNPRTSSFTPVGMGLPVAVAPTENWECGTCSAEKCSID